MNDQQEQAVALYGLIFRCCFSAFVIFVCVTCVMGSLGRHLGPRRLFASRLVALLLHIIDWVTRVRRQALEMQSRLQAMFLKTSLIAFKMCTSSSSSSELSRKEKTCIRNVVGSFVESKYVHRFCCLCMGPAVALIGVGCVCVSCMLAQEVLV
jgi:hypothetical protein